VSIALNVALLVALLLRAGVRAAGPGGLLAPVGRWWQWWLIYRPTWLPDKPSGSCLLCTTFYVPGLPAAALAYALGAGYWAVVVPLCVAALSDFLLSR
jgi:hypothetical protein